MSDLPAGGSRAALFLSSLRARVAPSARFWLIPAFLAFVVLVPLAREGLPVTQAGLLPLNQRVADYLYRLPIGAIGHFVQGVGWLKFMLVLTALLSAIAVGIGTRWAWKAQGWWVASLWITSPFVISLLYQRATPFLGLSALAFFAILVFLAQQTKWKLRTPQSVVAYLVALLFFNFYFRFLWLSPFWQIQPPLYGHQLFSGAWSPSDNWREWVGQPSFLIGVVPFGLGVLTALAAWAQRNELLGRRVFILLGITTVCIILPVVVPTPATLLLTIGTVCLVVAIGALPTLDTRYAAFPIQIGILAIALVSVYPYLRPAWFEQVPSEGYSLIYGKDELWLANLHIERRDGTLQVEAWWQSTAPMEKDYTAFVHFLDDQEQIVAQSDALLVDSDNITTTGWSPGYVVKQTYSVPDDAAITQIRYGVYDLTTLERLSVGFPDYKGNLILSPDNSFIFAVDPTP